MMRNIFILSFFVLFYAQSWSQVVIMGDAGFPEGNPMDCDNFGIAGTNFEDPGGGGNYPANFNDTTIFCPDLNLGTKATITFAINAGFEFDVDGSDFIQVYDGPNTNAPLLGIHNSITDPT